MQLKYKVRFYDFYCATLCIAWTMLSQDVCLSVCPSDTRRSIDTAKCIIKLFLSSGSHTILVFPTKRYIRQYSNTDPTNWGVECRGYEKLRFSANISLYLGNDTR